MATYTSNYGWTKPSGSDNVDISVLNNNLDDQDSTIHDAFLNMAPPFSESSTYAVDDIVLYTTGLYKCHTAVVTPGSWTGSANWQVYKLSEGGSGGGGTSNYNDLTNKPQINGVTLSGNKTTSDLGINADNVMMSDGVTSAEDAVDGAAKKAETATDITMTPVSGITIQSSRIMKMDKLVIAQLKTKWSTPTINETHIITFNGFDVGGNYAVGVVTDSNTKAIGAFILSSNRLYIRLSESGITSDTVLCMTIIGFTA